MKLTKMKTTNIFVLFTFSVPFACNRAHSTSALLGAWRRTDRKYFIFYFCCDGDACWFPVKDASYFSPKMMKRMATASLVHFIYPSQSFLYLIAVITPVWN